MASIKFAAINLCFLTVLAFVNSLPSGAPTTACADMTPNHLNYEGQTSPAPFRTVPAQNTMSAGGSLNLLLESTSAVQFKGFLNMAFDASNPSAGPIGTITNVSNGKVIECTAGVLNAATHVDNLDKQQTNLVWNAPEGFTGTVVFWTTFVQQQDTFWVKVPSTTVTVQ